MNFFSVAEKPITPFINFRYKLGNKIFLTVYKIKSPYQEKYLIKYEKNNKLNEVIWTTHRNTLADFIKYLKLLYRNITLFQKDINLLNVPDYNLEVAQYIIIGSNIGFPDTTFESNNEKLLFQTIGELLSFLIQVDIEK
jgi:hypothetical protein